MEGLGMIKNIEKIFFFISFLFLYKLDNEKRLFLLIVFLFMAG